MQKLIRITAIVTVALMALSVILILVSVPLQEAILEHKYGNEFSEYTSHLPIFPSTPFSVGILRLICTAALLLVCFSKKTGIRFEIIIFALMLIMIPVIDYVYTVSGDYTMIAEYGANYYGAYALAEVIADNCMIFSNFAQAIAYALCGMSVVYKRMKKETEVTAV